MAHFKDQLDAVHKKLHAKWEADGHPSRAQREQQLEAAGDIEHHEDGSRTVKMSPEMMELFKLQCAMFEFKFGRAMGPEDPVFFDVEADVPQSPDQDVDAASFVAAVKVAGVDVDAAADFFGYDDIVAEYRKKQQ
jgi:hypothetical protein